MNKTKNTLSNRLFGLIFAIIFLLIGLFPWLNGGEVNLWLAMLSGLFFILAVAFHQRLTKLNQLWQRFGNMMHKLVSPILMGVVFFGTVLPTGIALKMFSKDPMRRKYQTNVTSYWQEREEPISNTFFDNQF